MKTIGILGGMGPEASAHFYNLVNKVFQEKYNAVQDTDFPSMFIYNCPLKGFDETGITDTELVKSQLIAAVKKLEAIGCDFIVIPCNTVHLFIEEMRTAINIPILSIIEEAINKTSENKIGIICSETTNQTQLYQSDTKKIIYPNTAQQEQLNEVIINVMAGKQGKNDTDRILSIIENYDINEVIIGCTELPLAIEQKDTKLKLLDTLAILAESTADFAK